MPLAEGTSRDDLMMWGLRQAEAATRCNCRLYEARRANMVEKFDEPFPVICKD